MKVMVTILKKKLTIYSFISALVNTAVVSYLFEFENLVLKKLNSREGTDFRWWVKDLNLVTQGCQQRDRQEVSKSTRNNEDLNTKYNFIPSSDGYSNL